MLLSSGGAIGKASMVAVGVFVRPRHCSMVSLGPREQIVALVKLQTALRTTYPPTVLTGMGLTRKLRHAEGTTALTDWSWLIGKVVRRDECVKIEAGEGKSGVK